MRVSGAIVGSRADGAFPVGSERCCGVFSLNTGIRVLVVVQILMSIILIADPWSTPFMRAVVLCEEYPSKSSSRKWIQFPSSVQSALSMTDLVLGISGFILCAMLLYGLESRLCLLSLVCYFLVFGCLRVIWAFYLGFARLAADSIMHYWRIIGTMQSEEQSIMDACIARHKRSAIVDAITCLCIYLYFSWVLRRKFLARHSTLSSLALETHIVEGERITDPTVLGDLNLLGSTGRFFVGKPINQRVLGRPASNRSPL